MTDHDPLTVECPDCLVAAGAPCIVSTSDTPFHVERHRLVDLRNLEHGTCALCGHFMVRGTVLDADPDAWHPDETDAAACPDLGDPATDWERYATNVNLGLTAGHPGIEHFVATDAMEEGRRLASQRDDLIAAGVHPSRLAVPVAPPLLCPECAQGKHINCARQALDPATDDLVACGCNDDAHRTADGA